MTKDKVAEISTAISLTKGVPHSINLKRSRKERNRKSGGKMKSKKKTGGRTQIGSPLEPHLNTVGSGTGKVPLFEPSLGA